MATKMLLRSGSHMHDQLLRVFKAPTWAAPMLRNCPRCFSFKYISKTVPTTVQTARYSQIPILSNSVTMGTARIALVGSLLLQKAQTSFLLCSRWISDSKTEDENEERHSSSEDAENAGISSKSSQESDDLELLDKDARGVSESSNQRTETALFHSESRDSDFAEKTETASGSSLQPQTENIVETSEDVVETSEDVRDETTSSLVIRRNPEESDFIDDEKTDLLASQDTPLVLEKFIQPYLPTESLTLATYVNHSPSLQKLVDLGVDLSKIDKKAKIGNMLVKMDFDRHMKDKIILLHSVGVTSGTGLGRFLTINPFFLTEDLQNLETRLLYLRSKKFSEDAITQILNRAPYFLSFSIERVDSKLGFYQKELSLTGSELRNVITKTPKLVTFKIQRIKENIFVFHQQLGFTTFELKKLILREPSLLLRGKEKLICMFDYLHNHMGVPHKQILKNPQVFNGRVFKMQERHQFLKLRGRAQYDPTQPNYVALERLTKLPDDTFCEEIAKSSVEEYDNFLKTL